MSVRGGIEGEESEGDVEIGYGGGMVCYLLFVCFLVCFFCNVDL